MKIRRNDFSNLRQLRGSSCWSALDETRHAPREFHSFNRAIRRQPSFFARDRAIWKRGKISPDTLHRAPTTFHLVNPFHRSFVYFSSRVFLVSFLFFFSTFQHRFKDPRGKSCILLQDTRDIIINAQMFFLHNFTRPFLSRIIERLGNWNWKISRSYIIHAGKERLLYSKERRKFIISTRISSSSDKFTVSNYGKTELRKINDEINDAQRSVSHTCFLEVSFQSIANFLFVILLYYSSKEIINKNKKLGREHDRFSSP